MVLGYIYKLTLKEDTFQFKKGECYIGKHNGAKKHYISGGKIIKRIISKHGKTAFDREILSSSINDQELLCFLEIYYIDLFKCNRSVYNTGLNLTKGGEGIFGYKHTEEVCKNVSERIKRSYLEGRRKPPTQKMVYQYNLYTGELIKSFENCTQVARELNVCPSSVAYCARGKMNSCKGFGWSYILKDKHIAYEFNKKPIVQYDLNNNFIKKWRSATDVNKELGFKNSSITNCCKKVSKTSNGFIWEYDTLTKEKLTSVKK